MGIPHADLARAVSRQMKNLQLQSADLQRVAVLDNQVHLDRPVPVLAHDLRVGKTEAFARLQVEVSEHFFRRRVEARQVFGARDEHRIFDDRPVERMCDHLGAVALLENGGIAGVVVVEVGNEDILEVVLFLIELLDEEGPHAVVVLRGCHSVT